MRLHVPCTDEELSGCTKVWQVTARCAADSNVEKEQKENKYWTLVHQVETNECLSVSAGCVNTQLFANTFAMSMLFLQLSGKKKFFMQVSNCFVVAVSVCHFSLI